MFDSNFFNDNPLKQYVDSLDDQAIAWLSNPTSDAKQLMNNHIMEILGQLPENHFGHNVSTDRESLGHLIASSMAYGYFLQRAEQRSSLVNALGMD